MWIYEDEGLCKYFEHECDVEIDDEYIDDEYICVEECLNKSTDRRKQFEECDWINSPILECSEYEPGFWACLLSNAYYPVWATLY